MAKLWSGFSLEDQEKIKSELENNSRTGNEADNGLQGTDAVKEAKSMHKKNKSNLPKKPLSPIVSSSHTTDLPSEALLSNKTRLEKGTDSPVHVKLKIVEDTSFEIMETVPLENGTEEEKDNNGNENSDHFENDASCTSNGSTLFVDLLQNGGKKEPVNLDEFEKKQKIIEEQNRLKKQMLAKTLALRKMKTQAEAQKLQQIQEELSKLDASLTNDVCILRSHIEVASAELTEAERRYAKAEREFIEAKQLLFNKRERKDLLTEHLCAIIEQNELRKAHRLTDLMVQLDDDGNATENPLNRFIESVTADEA